MKWRGGTTWTWPLGCGSIRGSVMGGRTRMRSRPGKSCGPASTTKAPGGQTILTAYPAVKRPLHHVSGRRAGESLAVAPAGPDGPGRHGDLPPRSGQYRAAGPFQPRRATLREDAGRLQRQGRRRLSEIIAGVSATDLRHRRTAGNQRRVSAGTVARRCQTLGPNRRGACPAGVERPPRADAVGRGENPGAARLRVERMVGHALRFLRETLGVVLPTTTGSVGGEQAVR